MVPTPLLPLASCTAPRTCLCSWKGLAESLSGPAAHRGSTASATGGLVQRPARSLLRQAFRRCTLARVGQPAHLHDNLHVCSAVWLHDALRRHMRAEQGVSSSAWSRSTASPSPHVMRPNSMALTELGRTTYFFGVVVLTCGTVSRQVRTQGKLLGALCACVALVPPHLECQTA